MAFSMLALGGLLLGCEPADPTFGSDPVEIDTGTRIRDTSIDTGIDTGADCRPDTSAGVTSAVRISEVLYEPLRSEDRERFDGANWGPYVETDDDDTLEYVEVANAGPERVDLTGWAFDDGVHFEFPAGTTIEPGAFLVVAANPELLAKYQGVDALGPYEGHLDNDGEKVELVDGNGTVADALDYASLPPWPVGPSALGLALERISLGDERTTPDNWRASRTALRDPMVGTGTPGAANSVAGGIPPFVCDLAHTPLVPEPQGDVTITARVAASEPIGVSLELLPNRGASSVVAMFDDGKHGDGAASDGVYGVSTRAGPESTLTGYRVRVETERDVFAYPYDDDPSPTRAFSPASVPEGRPQWHLFLLEDDVAALDHAASISPREDLDVDGTLVIDDVAYPHIRVSLGGRWNRANEPYAWHFSLNPDATFGGATALHTTSLSAETQQAVFEAFDKVLDPALTSQLVDIVVTTDERVRDSTMYVAYEAPKGHWLDRLGYDDETEVYKARSVESASPRRNSDLFWFGDLGDERADNGLQTDDNFWGAYGKEQRALEPPTEIEELVAALNDLDEAELLPWLDAHVDLEQVYTTIAMRIYLRLDDFCGHNHYLLLPGGGKWQILSYDFDAFGRYAPLWIQFGSGTKPGESQDWERNMLIRRTLESPTLTRIYDLYVRRLLDAYAPEDLMPSPYTRDVEQARDVLLDDLEEADLPSPDDAPVATPCAGPSGKVAVSVGSGWDAYATSDGSDPRLSLTRVAVTDSLSVKPGTVLRLAAAESDSALEEGRWTDDVRCLFDP